MHSTYFDTSDGEVKLRKITEKKKFRSLFNELYIVSSFPQYKIAKNS